MQAQLHVLATQAEDLPSSPKYFENRSCMYPKLMRMGANIRSKTPRRSPRQNAAEAPLPVQGFRPARFRVARAGPLVCEGESIIDRVLSHRPRLRKTSKKNSAA